MAVLAIPVVKIGGSEVLGQPGQFSEPLPQSKFNFSFRQGLTCSRLSLNLLCDQWWPRTPDLLASTSEMLGLYTRATTPGFSKFQKQGFGIAHGLACVRLTEPYPCSSTHTERQQAIVYQVRMFILAIGDNVKGLRGFGAYLFWTTRGHHCPCAS